MTIRARIRILILAALVAAAPATARAQSLLLRGPDEGQVRALVIGVDAYQHVRPLKGAVPDARDLETALRRAGVTDVTALIDERADRDSLISAIEGLVRRTRAGDLVLLSIAGHGAQEPERVKGSQPDGMDTVFLLPGFDTTYVGSKQRIVGTEFNHFIKQFEERGARVLFVADTCHGGGLTRDADPRAAEMSFRQVPTYHIPNDAHVPVSTAAEAFLTELDFEKSAFLAAVDRKTKSPEVRVPGIEGYRGALSYAVARAIDGAADANRDGKVTLKELFGYVRQVVYQLSDQRQNPVTLNSPNRDIDRDVAFELTRAVKIVDAAPGTAKPNAAAMPAPTIAVPPQQAAASKVRIASLDGQASQFAGLAAREAAFEVVPPSQAPELVWDPASGDVLAGADVIAYRMKKDDLPSAIDRAAAVRELKRLAATAPQSVKVTPNDKLNHNDSRVAVEIGDVKGRALVLFNIAGDGTVQMLYPIEKDPLTLRDAEYRLPVRVRPPFGSDLVVAVTSAQPMPQLEQAIRALNQRRGALQALWMLDRYRPADAKVGAASIFTAP
jgi:uncharacterized caspase-like protein